MVVMRQKKQRAPYVGMRQIARLAAEKCGFYQKDIQIVSDAIVQAIRETLAQGTDVQVVGLGVFRVKTRPAGLIRNPKDGVKRMVPEKRFVKFRSSATMNAKMAGGE